jgi:hypothetical protein
VANLFRTEIDDRHLHFDGDRITFSVEIAAGVEVVFIDRRRAVDAIGPSARSMASMMDDFPELLSPIRTTCPGRVNFPSEIPRKFLIESYATRTG